MTKNIRIPVISTILLILVYIFNYLSSSWQFWADQANLAQVFPFPYMPPWWTFMIAWAIIYLWLWVYLMFSRSSEGRTSEVNKSIYSFFWATCILNILRITATSMERYSISVALIFWLYIVLMKIIDIISQSNLSTKEKRMVQIPFWLYYWWISLATSIIAISQFVYQRNVELPLWQTWTILVVWIWLLVAVYSRLKWRNIGQLLISILAFIWIASVLL